MSDILSPSACEMLVGGMMNKLIPSRAHRYTVSRSILKDGVLKCRT